MTPQPPGRRLDVSAEVPAEPIHRSPAVLGWPDALRVVNDPEAENAQPLQRFEAAISDLLARGFEVLEGIGVAVRLRVDGLGDTFEVAGGATPVPVQRHCVAGWPPESPGVELLRLEELADGGPALDAERSMTGVEYGDLTSTRLWPAVTAAMLGLGIRSVLAVPILDETGCLGSLVLFSTEIHDYPALVMTAKLGALASHVSVLLANATAVSAANRTISQLRDAILSRGVIEQAKGVLMAREKIDADTAWQYLVRISQRTHRKLRDISIDIVGKATNGWI